MLPLGQQVGQARDHLVEEIERLRAEAEVVDASDGMARCRLGAHADARHFRQHALQPQPVARRHAMVADQRLGVGQLVAAGEPVQRLRRRRRGLVAEGAGGDVEVVARDRLGVRRERRLPRLDDRLPVAAGGRRVPTPARGTTKPCRLRSRLLAAKGAVTTACWTSG